MAPRKGDDGDMQVDYDKDENISFETSKGVKVTSTFDAMGIREDLLRGLYSYGFEKPSAIQQRAIMPICSGRDVIAQAQSGTGKTSMISLALCQMLDTSTREVQALVLSPTRELATQTEKTALALGNFMSVQVHACIGGRSVSEDIKRLDHGVHIVSGTPGRVFDMIKRRNLSHAKHQDPHPRRGGRDAQQGFQGTDIRRVPVPAPRDAGGAGVRHAPDGRAGDDEQVHDGSRFASLSSAMN